MVQCFTPDRRKKDFTLQIRSHSKCLRKKPQESKLYIYMFLCIFENAHSCIRMFCPVWTEFKYRIQKHEKHEQSRLSSSWTRSSIHAGIQGLFFSSPLQPDSIIESFLIRKKNGNQFQFQCLCNLLCNPLRRYTATTILLPCISLK